MAEGIRKRGKTWSYYFDTAKINGKRQKIEKGGFHTQKEAINARNQAIAEYNRTGQIFSPSEISVSDYLDYWLENVIKKNIDCGYSYNTYLNYESVIRLHLKPAFGIYKLGTLQYKADKIQNWIYDLKLKGFSKNTIGNFLSCLSSALGYALVPLKYIENNPCLSVHIGKMPVNHKAKAHAEYVLSKQEFNQILERFPQSNYFHLSILLPYYIGTRIGETFAIDLLHDVDFENHSIHINNQLTKIDKTWVLKTPKYDSFRTIKIGKTLETTLKETITERKRCKMKYGAEYLKTYVTPQKTIVQVPANISVPYQEIMPLCVKERGELLTPDSFKYCARIIHYELGNSLFHSHCLRHPYVKPTTKKFETFFENFRAAA